MASHYQAQALADVVEVAHRVDSESEIMQASDFAAAEVAAALNLTRRASEDRVELAVTLRVRLSEVWRLLEQGEIDVPRAITLARGTDHLDEKLAREIVDQVADAAPRLTTGQLRARVQRLCLEAAGIGRPTRRGRRGDRKRRYTGTNSPRRWR